MRNLYWNGSLALLQRERRSRITAVIVSLLSIIACSEKLVGIRDDLNRPVRLPAHISRVVTLAPNLTEIVFAIGGDNKVVGTDDFSNEPLLAARLPKVGGMQPNIEKITALRPDVVIATTNGNHPNLAPALEAVHVPLFVVRTDRLDEIATAMERLGTILGLPQAGIGAKGVRDGIEAQRRQRTHSPRVLFAVWTDPLYVGGKKTFADDLLTLTGAQNIVQVEGWPQFSLEALVSQPPDIILFPSKSVTPEQIERLFRVTPELKTRITFATVDEDRFTRPGPRVVAAAAELNAILDRWERQAHFAPPNR